MMSHIEEKLKRFPELFALSALLTVAVIWSRHAGLTFHGCGTIILAIAALLTISYVYGRNGRSRALSEMGYYGAMAVTSGIVNLILSYLAARLNFPLSDVSFVAIDAALGFNLQTWFSFLASHKSLDFILKIAYFSLLTQAAGTIVYFAVMSRGDRNRELFWLMSVSSFITIAISGVIPALGPYQYFNFALERAVHLPHVEMLRQPGEAAFLLTQLEGIIVLPSYHTVLAIIFAYVHRGQRFLFPCMAALNSLMIISTPTHGGHYLIDLIAGAVVAALAIYIVHNMRYISVKRLVEQPDSGTALPTYVSSHVK